MKHLKHISAIMFIFIAVAFLFFAGCTAVVHPVKPMRPRHAKVWVPAHHNAAGIWIHGHWAYRY